MTKLDEIGKRLLIEVADLHEIPEGAYNIRSNSESAGRASTANIDITPREDGQGLTVRIKPDTKNESVHIPVVMTKSGIKELVYNDFYIGENADVTIVAGCGIDNCGSQDSEHDGIHRFYVGKNAKVRYVEKHYGSGEGSGKRILNPGTEVYQEEEGAKAESIILPEDNYRYIEIAPPDYGFNKCPSCSINCAWNKVHDELMPEELALSFLYNFLSQ